MDVRHTHDLWLPILIGSESLEGRESLDSVLATGSLVSVVVAIDRSDVGETLQVLSSLFIGRLQVLAVATWITESHVSVGPEKVHIYLSKFER